MLSYFSIDTAPLNSQTLFNLGPVPVTNAMLYGWAAALVVILFFTLAAMMSRLYPKSKLAFFAESVTELIYDVALNAFGDRPRALKHLPFLATLFVFIFTANISGLLPGVDTLYAHVNGQHISILRSFTTDLNATLAMAILTIGSVQYYAIRELGLKGHFRHYFSDNPLKPVNLFIGINEVFGEFLRIVTLSMRLFGVIYAGEVLLITVGALAGNLAFIATLPVMFLELFFCAVQAYVFMMLTAAYLSMATAHQSEPEEKTAKVGASTVKLSKAGVLN